MIFHPFRIPGEFNDRNEMSTGPHFHIIGFGSLVNGDAKQSWHLDMPTTDELYKEEGVVVKIMHYDRDNGHVGVVKSVFDTAEYVLSHQGIAWNKERVVGDLNGYNAWVLQHNEKNMLSFILPSPQSNNNYHDLLLDLGITEENKKNYSPLKDPVDFFDTIDIDKVTGDSLSWQKFLRSPLGNLVLHYIQMLKLSGEFPSTSKSNFTKKPRLHPIETIHWFGIMGNSKKHIVGIKREKKVFYCIPCDNEIPQSLMSYVRIRKPSDSVLGPKGPPDDPLSVDLGLKSPPEQWIPSTDIGEYFEEYMIKGKKHSGIFLVPDEYVEPVSNSVKRYLFV